MGVVLGMSIASALASMVVASPAVSQTAVAKVQPELATQTVTGTFKPRMTGGFRMEGAPEVDVVFGDTRSYRLRIDRFFTLSESMTAERQRFSRRVQASMAVLLEKKRGCPKDGLAPQYYGAHQAAEEYRRLGIALEIEYTAIRTLHRYGESQGLTPDYRWKVNKVTPTYRATLTDYREIQVALVDQLDKELRYRGCRQSTLLTLGQGKAQTPIAYSAPVPPPRRSWRKEKPKPVVAATTATFSIDNRSCDQGLDVYADGVLLGEVGPKKRAAFQALAGNHAICLIRKDSNLKCGQSGTVRTAYVHDGWAMTLHCRDADASSKR